MTEPRPMRTQRQVALLLSVVAVVAAGVGAAMMAAAWDHNPQEEFHGTDRVHWGPWLGIGLSWFFALFLPFVILTIVLWFAGRRRRLRVSPPAV